MEALSTESMSDQVAMVEWFPPSWPPPSELLLSLRTMLPCVLLQCHVRLAQVGQTRHGGSGVQNLDVILGGDAVQAILETLLSRSSRLSMAKQQDAGNGGEDDGIISADISSLPGMPSNQISYTYKLNGDFRNRCFQVQ